MKISEKFNLPVKGHKDIDFVNIDTVRDTRLFLDPYVMQALPDGFCQKAFKSVNSFFTEVFATCAINDNKKLYELLAHASEPNETNLGMKTISQHGKGSTPDELTELFYKFYKDIIHTHNMNDLGLNICIYIKGFDHDKMSDLITNIIRNLLFEFTVSQCLKWNMPLDKDVTLIGHYWDVYSLTWAELKGNAFLIDGKSFLLVPKIIVRREYTANVERYIKQYILKELQQKHLDSNSELCTKVTLKSGRIKLRPPKIDELYRLEVTGIKHKTYAVDYSELNRNKELSFIKDILNRIREGYGSISDEELDRIVNKIITRHDIAGKFEIKSID
jgi:hypothetical protein